MAFSPGALAAFLSIAGAAPMYAQSPGALQISGTGGLARIAGEAAPVSSAWRGASFAVRAENGYLKFDYEHFRRYFANDFGVVDGPDQREQFHLIGAGWVIESMPGRVTPFFQAGATFGIQTSNRERTKDLIGPALSGGATVAFANGSFIRPELRWKLLRGPIMLFQPGITVGWRF